MSKHLSALNELAMLKAEFESRSEQIKAKALAELREQLTAAKAEVVRIEREITHLEGNAGTEPAPKIKRLKPIENSSEEWNKVAKQIAIVLKNYKDGLNGKAIAKKLGLTAPNEIKRVQPVIVATTRREGEGVGTRYFLV